MIRHGEPPYLEASSAGDKRFSAFFARIATRDFRSIEEIYQSSKIFEDGKPVSNWKDAKGKKAINQGYLSGLYITLWREYIEENQHLVPILINATGISDKYGQSNHECQATSLWIIRHEYIRKLKEVPPETY